ncbi:MFS transporter [Prauserella endophytica]|uniref:MFS transporter n=1 Tax=Prauserella endophytica TaxID=1592324 RepID=UPI001E31EA08|nr:MFS transporter [Prauserella endophytica]
MYVGALLGPFGGGVVAAILPEIGASFAVSPSVAASALTSYLVPFAALMLVSGTLGERWGQARTIRLAYVVYAVAAVGSALAPWFWLFQVTRGVQGCANAFTLPLLMAKLAEGTPRERLGRALGLFGAMQAVGQTSAPLVGGLAAEASWRWAFAGIALVGAVLAACPLPPDQPRDTSRPTRLRDSWRRDVLLPGLVGLVGWACLSGVSFLVAFRLEDAFGLSSGPRGLVLTGFGVAGILTARVVGGVNDRYGPRPSTVTGLVAGALLLAAIGFVDSLAVAAACWAVAGFCGQLIMVGINSSVLSGGERGRGGAISVVQAMRFVGMAAAPAAFTAPYHHDAALGFGLPAALLLLVTPLTAVLRRTRSRE